MKKTPLSILGFALIFLFIHCNSESRQEKIVKAQCSACHAMPDPATIPTEIWKKSILPQMSYYYVWQGTSKFDYANRSFYQKKAQLPMNDKTWELIEDYFVENSPEKLTLRTKQSLTIQDEFEEIPIDNICQFPAITAVQVEENGTIYCACNSHLFQLDDQFKKDTLLTSRSMITQIKEKSADEIYLLNAGQLGPHNQPKGSLNIFNRKEKREKVYQKDLYRPVYMNLQADNIYISEYGNDQGRLSVLNEQDSSLTPLANLSGSYRTFITDIDRDGAKEIIAQFSQAHEGVYVFKKRTDGTQEMEKLIAFPPQFGFSDLDTADINSDGFMDFVISNGDNADFSNIAKNYHGVRIYLNDKKGNFKESYFYPLYGATQLRCLEADGDGKTDIIVASFFPNDIEESITLLTNQTQEEVQFKPSIFEHGTKGRWMVMQDGDIDQDGDMDVILGSFVNGPTHLSGSVLDKWLKESVDLLVLKNKQIQ